jgi:predicted GNAT family N-acyltransferase
MSVLRVLSRLDPSGEDTPREDPAGVSLSRPHEATPRAPRIAVTQRRAAIMGAVSPPATDPSSSERIEVRWAESSEELSGALEVRDRVFHLEQGVPREEDLDGLDEEALHVVALGPDGAVIGTLRLFFSGEVARIGRVAVERDWRARGVASRMLVLALSAARERGFRRARLAAQLEATGVYARAGFAVESEPFEDAGIPHVWMGRELAPED